MKKYKIVIKTLTPVHIGSGDVLDPLEYVIKDRVMYVFDQQRFISNLTPKLRQRFVSYIDEDKMVELRSFIRENFKPDASYVLYRATVEESVEEEYERNIGDRSLRNQLQIQSFIRPSLVSGNLPYIPGSSLKGAIRTAFIDAVLKSKESKHPQWRNIRRGRELEGAALGYGREGRDRRGNLKVKLDVRKDPFWMFKVEDVYFPQNSLGVYRVYNVTKNRQSSIPMTCEMLKPQVVGTGYITITDDESRKINKYHRGDRFKYTICMDDVVKFCDLYYKKALKKEEEKFSSLPSGKYYKDLLKAFSNKDKKSVILRLGKFSQIEYITFNPPYRRPRVPRSKGWGNSRNLVSRKYPAGWVWIVFKQVS